MEACGVAASAPPLALAVAALTAATAVAAIIKTTKECCTRILLL
jgi:hypothetical protein